MQLNIMPAYFHTGAPNSSFVAYDSYIAYPKAWPHTVYRSQPNPANSFDHNGFPINFGTIDTSRPVQQEDPCYHWRSRQFRSSRIDAGMFGTRDFIYSAWYRKGPNGETMVWELN